MKFKYRRYYLYYWGRCLAFIVYLMPLSMGRVIAKLLSRIAFFLVPKYRNITIDNLRSAFPDKSEAEINKIAIKVFENLGKVAVELVNFPKINKSNIDKLVRMDNAHILDEEYKKGKGIVLLTAHFGNWEMLALTLRVKDCPGYAIGRRIYFHKYDEYLNRLRRVNDVNIIYRDESLRKVLKILKANNIMGVLADQDVDSVEGIFVNFFGRPTYTPVGPAVLSMVSGAAIVPAFIVREGSKQVLKVEKPIERVDTGNREADIATITQKWSDVVESYIRKYPDHWVWMHRRWKTRPK